VNGSENPEWFNKPQADYLILLLVFVKSKSSKS
jgi:hypothetical protein